MLLKMASKSYNPYKKSKNKYHAKKVVVNGKEFDSQKEAKRYGELCLLQRAGIISDLQCQVSFELIPTQYETVTEYTPKTHKEKQVQKVIEKSCKYIADFVYERDGKTVVEDVKGYRDGQAYQLFVLKRKLMLWVHGIRVEEI